MVWTVSALVHAVADTLAARFGALSLQGEISGFTKAASGHWYLSLKDAGAQVRCVMFRNRNLYVDFAPRDGQLVQVRAQVAVYEPRGDLQLIVESMRPAGQGALYERFLQIKARLQAEGLFDAARKRAISPMPRALAVVTSLKAAALADVLSALKRRAPHVQVIVYPCTVQGTQAPLDIVRAVEAVNSQGYVDTLLLVRGGGSLEDLWAFNDEALARAVAASRIPVISGVGHETDFTIVDFVADLRAPTPTAAAELAATPRAELRARLNAHLQGLRGAMHARLQQDQQTLDQAGFALQRLKHRAQIEGERLKQTAARLQHALQRNLLSRAHAAESRDAALRRALRALPGRHAQTLREHSRRLYVSLHAALARHDQHLARISGLMHALSPQRTLERGYSVLLDNGDKAVRSAAHLAGLKQVRALLADGQVDLDIAAAKPSGTDL
jgi:exodeoxyribonuclease VII large subunit